MAKYATTEHLFQCDQCEIKYALRELILETCVHRCPNCKTTVYVTAHDYSMASKIDYSAASKIVEKIYAVDLNGRAS